MFQALFTLIFNILATIVQVVCLPLNAVITNLLPDLAEFIDGLFESLNYIFVYGLNLMSYLFNFLPDFTKEAVTILIEIQIAKLLIYTAIHLVPKVWNLVQKLKFW